MNKRRLLKLADHLETVPRKQFDMSVFWDSYRWNGKNECGTAGCALGHACDIPSFKRAGLKRRDDYVELAPANCGGFAAARIFFDLDEETVEYLFDEQWRGARIIGRPDTPKIVAKRIRKFVETGVVPE